MNQFKKIMGEINPDALYPTGYEDAIVGIVCTSEHNYVFLIDVNIIINKLVNEDNMDEAEAMEHLDFNIMGAYMGKNSPVYKVW